MRTYSWYFFLLFFFCQGVYAQAVHGTAPISEYDLQGTSAAEARDKLLEAAGAYLGTPYRYTGVDRRGLDCSGLVYLSFRDALNYPTPRTSESIYLWAEKIDAAQLQRGDLVFFITAGTRISHVGIYAGDDWFIHSASSGPRTGVIYSRLDESYWRDRYVGAGRAVPPKELLLGVYPFLGDRRYISKVQTWCLCFGELSCFFHVFLAAVISSFRRRLFL
jgi:probable lipoprotein NlpC